MRLQSWSSDEYGVTWISSNLTEWFYVNSPIRVVPCGRRMRIRVSCDQKIKGNKSKKKKNDKKNGWQYFAWESKRVRTNGYL